MQKTTILLIEDDESLRETLSFKLKEKGYHVVSQAAGEKGIEFLRKNQVGMIVSDIRMPGMDGMEVLAKAKAMRPETEIILMTAFGDTEDAVNAIKSGAYHYVTKPVSSDELDILISRALHYKKMEEDIAELHTQLKERYGIKNMIGNSPPMQKVFRLAQKAAASQSTVFITGESGTGKELIARMLHYSGPRGKGPFVAINCASVPDGLLESELFGHVRGAFTGAVSDKSGKFEDADKGTLFLDELGDMPVELQAKLLRALQEREIQRVGGKKTIKVDIRVIAATNKDIQELIRGGKFREDLFYRLSVIPIALPPLRDIRDDIPMLAVYFFRKYGNGKKKVHPDVLKEFQKYPWPGNTRELENLVEQMCVLSDHDEIAKQDIPEQYRLSCARATKHIGFTLPDEGFSLEELEKEILLKALERNQWNQTKTAEYLKMTRPTLIYRMEKFNLKKS